MSSALFQDIQIQIKDVFPSFDSGDTNQIPDCHKLNQSFVINNRIQKKLKFIAQDDALPFPEMGYEERIYNHGMIATRKNNWHDFFNAIVWKKFPKTKVEINALHQQEIKKQVSSNRTRKRDLLTLFDESGVIVMANETILELIKSHQWQQLFVDNRALWLDGSISIQTFGHALYEKYLNPYIGMTAQALLLNTTTLDIDDYLSSGLKQQKLLNSKSDLSPLPLLGIPRWHTNQNTAFYANSDYFR